MPDTGLRIAMLIDGDNAQYDLLEQMLEEVSRYGTVTIRRAYGDWTQPNLANWRPLMLAHAVQPIQQWRYTTGKNATDSALIIDAMDILYSGTVQGFCIVSSDSDFTRLCTRIREEGFFVMGMGKKQTPDSFIQACDEFVYVENLIDANESPLPQPENDTNAVEPASGEDDLKTLFRRAFDISVGEDRWAELGAFGNALKRLDPGFDSRTYGHKSLSLLVKSQPSWFKVKGTNKNGSSPIYIRMKGN